MQRSAVHRPYPESPALAHLVAFTPSRAWSGARADRFELVSRGDLVSGRLYRPDRSASSGAGPSGSVPLLLIQHDARGSVESPELECAAPWVRDGLAVAAIDLPLHGRRRSPKLSERLCEGFDRASRGDAIDPETRILMEEFARQSVSDLVRTLDALSRLPTSVSGAPDIDVERLAFMGLGLGAVVGAYLLAHDRRPRAAVLANPRAVREPADLDPATWLSRSSDVEMLVLAPSPDGRSPNRASRMLFEAAPEPRRLALHHLDRADRADRGRLLQPEMLREIRALLDSTILR